MRSTTTGAALICAVLWLALAPVAPDAAIVVVLPGWLALAGRLAGVYGLIILLRSYAPAVLDWIDDRRADSDY